MIGSLSTPAPSSVDLDDDGIDKAPPKVQYNNYNQKIMHNRFI